jgi:transporter family protein
MYSLLVILFWGLWAFIPKLALKLITWKELLFFGALGSFIVSATVSVIVKADLHYDFSKGYNLALVSSVLGTLGVVFFYKAIAKGNVSVVVPLTALYPVVVVILAILLLHESPSIYQRFGIVFAIAAAILISIE